MSTSVLPFIHAQGSWGEIGHQVGRMFAPSIERHLDAWTRHVMHEAGCSRAAVEDAAAPFAEPVREHAPFLWEELEGMARGSGLPISRLLILQARAEVMRANKAAVQALECTTFGLTGSRTASGATFLGQNVDLVPFVEEFGVIIRQYPTGAPSALLYTTAGLLGHNGLNEAGVVIGDLTNRELHATKGSPCQAPYATYTLATCRTGALSVTVREN